MEDQIFRFPHIAQQIFEQLDNESLANCREADRDWQDFINNEKFYKRKIQNLMLRYKNESWSHRNMSPLHLAAATGQTQVVLDIIKEEGNIDKYFKMDTDGYKPTWQRDLMRSPLHYAVGFSVKKREGYLSVCNALVENLDNKNPGDWDGCTPLHMAVHSSNDVLKLMMDNVTINNSPDNRGRTPLHQAPRCGLPKFKLIFENTEDKNPADFTDFKQTPLHFAAQWGELEICKFILENVRNKSTTLMNLVWGRMPTPWWNAEMHGQKSVAKFFQEKIRKSILTGVLPNNEDESSIIQASKRRKLN